MHAELIALYETTRELTWIRALLCNLSATLALPPIDIIPVYEDNQPCIDHASSGYIKSEATKPMAPKIFYPHQLVQAGHITINYVPSAKL